MIFGSTESSVVLIGARRGAFITVSTSAKPKAPTSAGMSPMPPLMALWPKVKRSWACTGSSPMLATKMPSRPINQPLTGSDPVRLPDIMTPAMPSQKNSKAPNCSAVSASKRREHGQAYHAEQRAGHRSGGGDAHGAPGLALARQHVAVQAGRGVGRGARDVEEDRRAAATVDGADVDADQHEDRVVGRHLHRQRREQRHPQRGGQARQQADHDPGQRGAQRIGDLPRPGQRGQRRGEVVQPVHAVTIRWVVTAGEPGTPTRTARR